MRDMSGMMERAHTKLESTVRYQEIEARRAPPKMAEQTEV